MALSSEQIAELEHEFEKLDGGAGAALGLAHAFVPDGFDDPRVRRLIFTLRADASDGFGWIERKSLDPRKRIEIAQDMVNAAMMQVFHYELSKTLLPAQRALCAAYCIVARDGRLDGAGFPVAVTVLETLLAAKLPLPAPLTTVAVYLVKNRTLDIWCDCSREDCVSPSPDRVRRIS